MNSIRLYFGPPVTIVRSTETAERVIKLQQTRHSSSFVYVVP